MDSKTIGRTLARAALLCAAVGTLTAATQAVALGPNAPQTRPQERQQTSPPLIRQEPQPSPPLNWRRDPTRRKIITEPRFFRHLYRGFLGRQPTNEEVRHWTQVMDRDNGPTEMVRAFMDSDEYFVRQVYLGLLGREPDASGKAAYVRMIQSGQGREEVVEAILASREFRDTFR